MAGYCSRPARQGGSGRVSGRNSAGEIQDHYVNSLEWQLPREVRLDGTALAFDRRPQPKILVRPGPGMLEDFIKLAGANDDAILSYAQQWGPLWLCHHRLYWQHDRHACYPESTVESQWYTRWEDLQRWRDLAAEARAVLRIARKLNAGQTADPEDWKVVPGRYDRIDATFVRWDDLQWIDKLSERRHEALLADDTFEQFEQAVIETSAEERSRPHYLDPEDSWRWEVDPMVAPEIQERLLGMVLDKWMERGQVRLAMFRQDGRRQIRLGGGGLIGALAVQLVFDVCRTDGLAICASCGAPYLPPKRRPRHDENSYCSDCGV